MHDELNDEALQLLCIWAASSAAVAALQERLALSAVSHRESFANVCNRFNDTVRHRKA